jgi:hypothetical protein
MIMTKKFISWLSFMAVFLSLYSCVHDELISSSDPASKEYHSKSLWKEDEIYIVNVKEIYEENEEKIRKEHGTPLWEYAMTMDKFDESYLLVPVRKNGEIAEVLEVPRFGKKIYFKYTNEEERLSFFRKLFIDTPKKTLPTSLSNNASKLICVTRTVSIWYPDSESNPNGSGHWGSSSYTTCYNLDIESFENPDDGSDGGGYDYPPFGGGGPDNPLDTITIPQNPCEKLKNQNQNQAFKDKVTLLDKDDIFKKTQETGYAAAYGSVPYEQMLNSDNGNVKLPQGNKYYGYMHVHLNMDGVVKIFSPYDITTFLTSCVANAKLVGNMADAYAMVITSEGNYILKYSGDGNFAISSVQLESWETWYKKQYGELYENNKLTQPNVEKLFTQFLQEVVNINGLEVYQSDKTTGNASKLQYNGSNNPVQPIPCPQ